MDWFDGGYFNSLDDYSINTNSMWNRIFGSKTDTESDPFEQKNSATEAQK